MTTAAELSRQLHAAKAKVDEAMDAYETAIQEDADADRDAKLAKATSFLTVKSQIEGKPTVAELEARVDKATADEQHKARLAEGMKNAAKLKVESARQWLSALQSLASLSKAEAQLGAWEPSETRTA